jgi:hypothetical protein
MKTEEIQAKKHLEAMGFESIVFEPDGNVTPDFALNQSIAVEVRRLNQHFDFSGTNHPLEKTRFKLYQLINGTINSIDTKDYEYSVYVFVEFQRPLAVSKRLKREIVIFLHEYLNSDRGTLDHNLSPNLKFKMIPTQKKWYSFYVLGSLIDCDSGGFIESSLSKNLQLAIQEKEEKVSSYLSRYPEWWLVLVDHVSYGIYDAERLKESLKITSCFNRIVLISPLDLEGEIIYDANAPLA